MSGVPDWPGTRVTWDLTPVEGGTKLLFGHRDFASCEGSLPMTGFNWAWYIISLKKYAETGTGSPHTGDAEYVSGTKSRRGARHVAPLRLMP